MSVQEMQAFLARLYVDDSFLRLFEIDANLVLDKYLLTEEERAVIDQLDPGEVRFFANSLKGKRRKLFQKEYSTLFAVDEKRIGSYFLRFYDIHRIAPEEDQSTLYQLFGRFMEDTLHDHPELPPYTSNLAKYERLCLWAKAGGNSELENGHRATSSAADSKPSLTLESRPRVSRQIRIGTFDYRVSEIAKQVVAGERPDEVPRQRSTLVFRSAALDRKMRVFDITEDTRILLEACDGRRSVSDIVAAFNRKSGEDLTKPILDTLERLLALEAIEV